jgi:hypothetical protein
MGTNPNLGMPLLIKRGEKLGGFAALAFRGDFFLTNNY